MFPLQLCIVHRIAPHYRSTSLCARQDSKTELGLHLRNGSRPNIPFKDDENIDLPIFNIVTIPNATNNFSISNKIGEGGFGLVYKCRFALGGAISV
ncbi:hypothetical protein CsSME_00032293 [Camellia sinensis var. sinensis]